MGKRLVAVKAMSIGSLVVEPGDEITREHRSVLPIGRLETLKRIGHIEETDGDE